MPPKTKVRVCKAAVKDDQGKVGECNFVFPKDEYTCRRRLEHITPLKSGFCAVGMCEGTNKRSPRTGLPYKTCEMWKTCPCDCHKTYDLMFSMSGMERRVVDNSGYSPPHNTYWVPTLEERAALHGLSNAVDNHAPIVIESPAPGIVPPTLARSYGPTATGRAARGELESWVKRVCDEWLVDNEKVLCTPAYVASCIQHNEGLGKAPSVGAISAVWDRWVTLGFAIIDKKPTRFSAYTEEGARVGLDALKEKAKRARRMKMAAANRGERV